MTRRQNTQQRRAQIVAATLDLLQDHPLHALSTRAIAARVGISQPALFRHFSSRDAILLAAIHQSREHLALRAATLLASGPVDDQLRRLAGGLLEHIEAHPWLPRLFFYSASAAGDPLQTALAQLPSMQRALVAERIAQGQRDGIFAADVDPRRAAIAFVTLFQGTLLQVSVAPELGRASELVRPMVETWLAALAGTGGPRGEIERSEPAVALDVRPILAGGADPLPEILDAVGALPDDGVLILVAPFRPTPLLTLLGTRGLRPEACAEPDGSWSIAVPGAGLSAYEDLRDLEAPEPLERVLLALSRLAPGASYAARTPRVPRLLLQRLPADVVPTLVSLADGSGLVHLRRAP